MRRIVAAFALGLAGCRGEAEILDLGGDPVDACALALIDASEALTVDALEQSRWSAGACYELTLQNSGDLRLEWFVLVGITGALDSSWNTSPEELGGGIVEARGLESSNNLSLEPGAAATIGFCLAC